MPPDPERYHKLQKERFAPFEDLVGLVRLLAHAVRGDAARINKANTC